MSNFNICQFEQKIITIQDFFSLPQGLYPKHDFFFSPSKGINVLNKPFFSPSQGLYPESNGMVGNTFYDPELDDSFRIGPKSGESKWWKGEPVSNHGNRIFIESLFLFLAFIAGIKCFANLWSDIVNCFEHVFVRDLHLHLTLSPLVSSSRFLLLSRLFKSFQCYMIFGFTLGKFPCFTLGNSVI